MLTSHRVAASSVELQETRHPELHEAPADLRGGTPCSGPRGLRQSFAAQSAVVLCFPLSSPRDLD